MAANVATTSALALALLALPVASHARSVTIVMELGGTLKMKPVAIADLPDCDETATGTIALVNDAERGPSQEPVRPGGKSVTLVLCDGQAWMTH
jgi:hypothetical protein